MDGFKTLPKMQHFKEGGQAKTAYCGGGRMMKKEGGEVDLKQDKALIKKAFKQHDEAEHDKEPTEIKLKKGGRSKKENGTVRKFKIGGSVTNVYEAKKSAGDLDNIKKTKDIKPGKAEAESAGKKRPKLRGSDVEKEKGKPAGEKDFIKKVPPTGDKKADAMSGAKKEPNKYKTGGAIKKYAEGSEVTEGENANIGDDTRARAMRWVQEQADKRESEKESSKTESRSKKASADDEAGKSRGRPAEGEPKTTVSSSRKRTREESIAAIPGQKRAGPSGGERADSTELGRNASALFNSTGPGKIATGLSLAAREGMAANAAQKAYNARAALRRSEEGLNAAEAAEKTAKIARGSREAKTLNPNAWLAGPKGMKENFKKGGNVRRYAEGKLVVSDPKAVSDKASRELEEALNPISMAKELYGKGKEYLMGSGAGAGRGSVNPPAVTPRKAGGRMKRMNTGGTAC